MLRSGVMIGRSVSDTPWRWRQVAQLLYHSEAPTPTRDRGAFPVSRLSCHTEEGYGVIVLREYRDYALAEQEQEGTSTRILLKPLFGLFKGERGGAAFRRKLFEGMESNLPISNPLYSW